VLTARRALGAVLLCAAAQAGAVSDAPLGIATPGPFRSLFLDMPLADARGAGVPVVELRWWAANDWSVPTRFTRGGRAVIVQGDTHADALQLAVTLPWDLLLSPSWARRVESTVELRATVWWGGWTDPVIEGWHRAINAWNFQRDRFQANRVGLQLAEEGGETLADLRHPRLALGDLTLRTQVRLAGDGESSGLALRADLKLPTGRLGSLGGSGGVDGGFGLAGSWAPQRWFTGHLLGSVRLVSGLPGAFPLQPNVVQWGVDLSLVFRVGRRIALLVEDRLSSALFDDGWTLEGSSQPEASAYYSLFRVHNQISAGVRVGEVTLFFSEDFTTGGRIPGDTGPSWYYSSNAPDFVIGVGWARRL
jgi:hypothetical protein